MIKVRQKASGGFLHPKRSPPLPPPFRAAPEPSENALAMSGRDGSMPWPAAPSFFPTPEPPPLLLSQPSSSPLTSSLGGSRPLASVKGAAEWKAPDRH